MYKYPYVDDPEPKERLEDLEDKIIRTGSRIFNIIITVAGICMLILFIYGLVIRYL